MLRLKAERRSLAKVSGATAPESRTTKTTDIAYCNTQSPGSNPRTLHVLSRVLDATLTLGIVAVLCAAVIGGGVLADAITTAVLIIVGAALASMGIAYLWVQR